MPDPETLVVSDPEQRLSDPFAPPVGPTAIVIFGAAGDLTRRKLLPSLHNLAASNLLDDGIAIVGIGRASMGDAEFQAKIRADLQTFATGAVDTRAANWLVARSRFLSGTFEDPGTYTRLAETLAKLEKDAGTGGNVLFYLATAPEYFAPIVERLGAADLVREEGGRFRRVIVEKPFGHDLESARKLNSDLRKSLSEQQIWRIDHYLGKETVQNILVFRFGNGMFEPIWNRRYVDNVQITVAESLGVEGRGTYYDAAGALRDMVPNHLTQLLALVAMEPPTSFEAEAIREEKAKVLRAIQPLSPERVITETVRGQYGAGWCEGKHVAAYRSEPDVDKHSTTETFVAMKLHVDNWRWADVPFYMRTGKRLPRRVSEISIQFRRPPLLLFRKTPVEHLSRNVLVIRMQPEEGISLRFGAKIPGPIVRMGNVAMDFRTKDAFGSNPSTGYETLLYDAIQGDATLFQRADMVEAGWKMVEPVLDVWKALPPNTFPNYATGSWGPKEADEMLERDGRRWRRIEE
ncbi:MAG TPA: glucose-6-phosphate dehydrogenase [Planctomycetota bacterium]|jgi:glucose-6-phosphate 1-dehydrogenase|nr:glucose-6-phosphate dehydrogenase [Planctomycetota bacterium]